MALEVKGMHSSGTWLPATVESLTNQTILNDNGYVEYIPRMWACGAAGSALPWHGRGRRFDPDQVHHTVLTYLNSVAYSQHPLNLPAKCALLLLKDTGEDSPRAEISS